MKHVRKFWRENLALLCDEYTDDLWLLYGKIDTCLWRVRIHLKETSSLYYNNAVNYKCVVYIYSIIKAYMYINVWLRSVSFCIKTANDHPFQGLWKNLKISITQKLVLYTVIDDNCSPNECNVQINWDYLIPRITQFKIQPIT